MKKIITISAIAFIALSSSLYAKSNNQEVEILKKKMEMLSKKFEERVNKKLENDKKRKSAIIIIDNKSKAILPTPYKSVLIGNTIAVFAKVKTPSLTESAIPKAIEKKTILTSEELESQRLMGEMNIPKSMNNSLRKTKKTLKNGGPTGELSYKEHDVRLYVGSEFNNWYVKKLTLHFVIFENQKTKETIKKYY